MTRWVMAVVAGLGLAAGVRADEWWIGYDRIVGTYTYPIHDMLNGGFEVGAKDVAQGVATFGGSTMRSWGAQLELGLAGGVGMPLGTWTVNQTDGEIPAAGMPNKYEGDQLELRCWTVPVLARVVWGVPLGPGRVSVSASAGMLLIMTYSEITDQLWVDTGGVWNAHKLAATDVKYGTEVESGAGVVGLPTAGIAPGYAMRFGEHDEIGIEVPVTIVAKRKIAGKEQTLVNPVTTQPNPYQMTAGIELGGLTIGGRVLWRRKF